MSSLPLQHECNMDEPEEHALWALVGLPGPSATAPLLLPPEVMRLWSKRLWDAGFRHHVSKQTVRYQPPAADHNWLMGSAGQWVDIDAPEVGPHVPSVERLSMGDKRRIYEELRKEFAELELPEGDMAEVREVDDDNS